MKTENKIFKIQTAFYKLLCDILKDEEVEIFKTLSGNLPKQFILIESVKEEFFQGKHNQFKIFLTFISESSKALELSGFMEKVRFGTTKNDFENFIGEEIISLNLLENEIKNSYNSVKIEGKMVYIAYL